MSGTFTPSVASALLTTVGAHEDEADYEHLVKCVTGTAFAGAYLNILYFLYAHLRLNRWARYGMFPVQTVLTY